MVLIVRNDTVSIGGFFFHFSRRVRDTTHSHCALVVVVGGLHRRFSGGAHGFSP